VKKSTKKRSANRATAVSSLGPLDWTPLLGAFREAFEWALDVAAKLARDCPEEGEVVERLRTFMHKRIANQPAQVRLDDALFIIGLILAEIERDLGPVATRGPWYAPALHLPTAADLWEPALPRWFGCELWLHTTPVPRASA
jgi:hypothetical protein